MAKKANKSTKEKAADLNAQRLTGDAETPSVPQDATTFEQPAADPNKDAVESVVSEPAAELTEEVDQETKAQGDEPEQQQEPELDFSQEPDAHFEQQPQVESEPEQAEEETPEAQPEDGTEVGRINLPLDTSSFGPQDDEGQADNADEQSEPEPEPEAPAEDNAADFFSDPDVLSRINELNDGSIIQRGEPVVVRFGNQSLNGSIAGHDVKNGTVSYHVSIQVSDSDFITGKQAETVEIPVEARFVSR